MSLYVLFYSQNLNADLAGQFGKDVRLDTVGRYNFAETSCPARDLKLPAADIIVVNRYDCPAPESFEHVATIKGVNEFLGFEVYRR